MPLIDHLFAIGPVRKAIWKYWYPFLTRRLQGEEVVFLNYAFETDPAMAIRLTPEDEPDRACIQLYHHVGTQMNLDGKEVLEVSCGHGGGASYLTRTQAPARYTGLDLNSTGIAFCKKRHPVSGLEFIQGDAEHLPFSANSYDVVINVEASHCYPDFPRFLAEVARVLRPGGCFLYADFRFGDGIEKWDSALRETSLHLDQSRDISPEVLRGMERNSARSLKMLEKKLPRFLHGLGRDFAGVKGSRVYTALLDGDLSYRSYCYTKA
ncbi:MAG: phthiotriol/phenolphthiotriol dimycocerosates methyltransferase [Luteolibacter sp.]